MNKFKTFLSKAFSLIELMVVIAIVGVLAAIATPAYKKYVISAKLGSVLPAVTSLMQQMTLFANFNNSFPSAYDLGLNATSGQTLVTSPTSISPHLTSVQIYNTGGGSCAKSGVIIAKFNNTLMNHAAGSSDELTCKLWHYKGIINRFCFFYSRSNTGVSYAVDLPGVVSAFSNSAYAQVAYTNARNNITYSQATCVGVP